VDLVARFRFDTPSRFLAVKLVETTLTYHSQPDPLDCTTPDVEGIPIVLSVLFESATMEPHQFFVERVAMTFS
jgi:hypothetical protein